MSTNGDVKSLDDIARLAGVSRATVSRAINNAPDVSERTRQKVLRIMRENNFRPSSVARALATRHTRVISLVIPRTMASTFTDPFFPTVTTAIMNARNNEYAFMLWMNDGTEGDEQFCERILSNSLSDGILLVSAFDHDPLVPRLEEANFPFVLIGPPPSNAQDVSYVDFDNEAGARAAVSHLLQLGRERIGIITGPLNTFPARERLRGYRAVLQHAGYPIEKALIVEGDYTEKSGHMRTKLLLAQHVDAIFATSDIMALGALRAIETEGLRVPDDISLIGFDDLFLASLVAPPLTSVRQPIEEVVSTATQMLIDWLEGNLTEKFQVTLPVELVVRETCGASLRL